MEEVSQKRKESKLDADNGDGKAFCLFDACPSKKRKKGNKLNESKKKKRKKKKVKATNNKNEKNINGECLAP